MYLKSSFYRYDTANGFVDESTATISRRAFPVITSAKTDPLLEAQILVESGLGSSDTVSRLLKRTQRIHRTEPQVGSQRNTGEWLGSSPFAVTATGLERSLHAGSALPAHPRIRRMFSWIYDQPIMFVAGVILVAVQFAAALPWLWAIDPKNFERATRSPATIGSVVVGILLGGATLATFMSYEGDSAQLQHYGQYFYGAGLHLQLLIDLFLILPQLLILVWPKGGAVALAAYREGWRQPMFWLIIVFAIGLTWFSVCIPYFTFGDDYKMMKQIGFDVVMLAAGLFGVLGASMSISEEIEGRTAVTLMSKPVNRRQFLIGKFIGILMACLAMSLVIGWNLNFALRVMPEFDKINAVQDPMSQQTEKVFLPVFDSAVPSSAGKIMAHGAGLWFADTFAHSLGIALGFGQVMILVAIASALATRIPFVVNLVLFLVIYFLGHLAPVIVKVTEGGGAGMGLVGFLGKLFDVLLPALEFFNMGPAIIRESPLDLWSFAWYVATVFGYAIIYTMIALLVGLILFEDRDLA